MFSINRLESKVPLGRLQEGDWPAGKIEIERGRLAYGQDWPTGKIGLRARLKIVDWRLEIED